MEHLTGRGHSAERALGRVAKEGATERADLGACASGWAAPRAEGVGIPGSRVGPGWGWDGGPLLGGRGLARFVPVGTGRPWPAEWAGAGQRFSSLRGVRSVLLRPATFPPRRGHGAGTSCPPGALGKGRSPGHPLPAPLEGGRRRKRVRPKWVGLGWGVSYA